jgi:hypothetical protein
VLVLIVRLKGKQVGILHCPFAVMGRIIIKSTGDIRKGVVIKNG